MKLSQMQDLGGCRAVLQNVFEVKELVRQYKVYHAKSPKDRSYWDGSDDFDYISRPKQDGYRGVHLIFRFKSASKRRNGFNGQRIEIQIRSKLQHAWATAVETAQLFTGQALKSRVKNASEEWLRFFALVSSAFAAREKTERVPGTPESREGIFTELREIVNRENIMQSLQGWNNTIHLLEDSEMPDADMFLLILDPTSFSLRVSSFFKDQIDVAQKAYERAEKDTENSPNIQVVLVAVEDLDALRRAYPNYYVDTKDFLRAVRREISPKKRGARKSGQLPIQF